MNNIAAYLRVSTKEQETDNQLPAVIAWAEAHGYNKECVVLYKENESGWRAGHQHELAQLLNDIRRGKRKYDYLVTFALDRLSRQGPAAILNLINELKNYSVKVVSISEPFTDLPFGFDDVLYSFLAWAAKYESDRKSQNTKAGLARTLSAGVTKAGKPIEKLGRPTGSKDKQPRRKKRAVIFKYSDERKSPVLSMV
jgi:DNA invertase Pin-like site-specific DNA recombinase